MNNIRTTQQIQDTLSEIIRNTDSSISLEDGQYTKDIVVDVPSSEFRSVYVVLKYVSLIQSTTGIAELTNDVVFKSELATALDISATELTDVTTWDIPDTITNDVDALIYRTLNYLASNFNLTRTSATSARFVQRFYRVDNNGGGSLTVPLGTSVQTLDSSPFVYQTVTSSAQVPTLDSTVGLYYVEETVEAVETGTTYNVALSAIKQISPVISQATSTTNSTVALIAQDEETDSSLISRVDDAWAGRELNTITGYELFAKSYSGVLDSKTADPSQPDLYTRNSAGGADIYIKGVNLVQQPDQVEYVLGTDLYLLQFQPATSVVSVIGSTSGAITGATLSESGGGYDKSARALNYLDLSGASVVPTDGEILTVNYYYDKLIYDIQAGLEADANKVIDADVLSKQGTAVYIDMVLNVVTFSGDDPSTEINSMVSALLNGGTYDGITYVGYLLGENLDKSDVYTLVGDIDDIDRINNSLSTIERRTGTSGADTIVMIGNEYAVLGTVTITWS